MSSIDESMIVRLLCKKRDVLGIILRHTIDISKVLDDKDTGKLEDILNLRQQAIEESDKIDEELSASYDGDIKELIQKITVSCGQLNDIYKEIAACLNDIKQQDHKNLTKANEVCSKISSDISKLKQTGNAMRGYGLIGGQTDGGAFIDTKK
jgi:DNA repair ATPase RecN